MCDTAHLALSSDASHACANMSPAHQKKNESNCESKSKSESDREAERGRERERERRERYISLEGSTFLRLTIVRCPTCHGDHFSDRTNGGATARLATRATERERQTHRDTEATGRLKVQPQQRERFAVLRVHAAMVNRSRRDAARAGMPLAIGCRDARVCRARVDAAHTGMSLKTKL